MKKLFTFVLVAIFAMGTALANWQPSDTEAIRLDKEGTDGQSQMKTIEEYGNNKLNNIVYESDNIPAMELLIKEGVESDVIIVDPPYNTGSDFVYRDDYVSNSQDYEEALGTIDESGNRLFKNTDANGRFHSDWCSMIYPRLALARNLLSNNGVIFISIDDNEESTLRMICDEVSGS